MILVWGLPGDSPVASVTTALSRLGVPVIFFDQSDSLNAELEMSVNGTVSGQLRLPGGCIDLEAITGAYLRPYDALRLPAISEAAPELRAQITSLNEGLLCWSELTPARVVNRPGAMASNHSKPYQAMLIQAQGFDIPATLLTSDVDALGAFWETHDELIYKSISGVRSIVKRLTPAHRDRFGDLAHCPTQFQQWIPGTDYRVHVAGGNVFACSVESLATDYRYPSSEAEAPQIQPFDLPDDLAEKCRRLVHSMSLELAGIDLRRTPGGQWFCFEVNPSPGFTYYEQSTGQPIAESIARLLSGT